MRRAVATHEDWLLRGVREAAAEVHGQERSWVDPQERLRAVAGAARRLAGLEGDATPYAAYALGRLSVEAAHAAQPYGLYAGRGVPPFMRRYDALLEEARVPSAPAVDMVSLAQAPGVLEAARRKASQRQAAVRMDAAAGGLANGSSTARSASAVLDAAAGTVARLWAAVLGGDAGGASTSGDTIRLSLDQVAFGARKDQWAEVERGLQRLRRADITLSLGPGGVGPRFFDMHLRGGDCELYALARLVDPNSGRLRATHEACGARREAAAVSAAAPAPEPTPGRWRGRTVPDARESGIRAFEHTSGSLLLTDRRVELSEAFVPLNFEPIRPYRPRSKPASAAARAAVDEVIDLENVVRFYAAEYALDSALVKAVIQAESGFDPHVVSRAGARGLMQLMPSTALEMGVEDIFDPVQNVAGGTQYLARMLDLFDGDVTLALAAYNAGPGTVRRYGGVPPYEETRNYIPKVLASRREFARTRKPVALQGALIRPAADYLPPEAELTTLLADGAPAALSVQRGVLIVLRNGQTMRGHDAVEMDAGVRLEVDTGWILVPGRHIDRVLRATG